MAKKLYTNIHLKDGSRMEFAACELMPEGELTPFSLPICDAYHCMLCASSIVIDVTN